MGVTIHYRGKLNSTDLKDSICEELADIAKEMEWELDLISEEEDNVKGIVMSPHPKSEPLSLLFGADGTLKDFRPYIYNKKNKKKIDDTFASIKTQFAPVEIHIAVIKLLKYLKKKYIRNLKVLDEGLYWDTGDEKVLAEKISFLNKMMDKLEGLLNEVNTDENDTAETYLLKLEKLLKEKFGDKVDIKTIRNPEK